LRDHRERSHRKRTRRGNRRHLKVLRAPGQPLYDVADLVPAAQTLFTKAVRTAAADLARFDSHAGYSYYSLALQTPCPPGYNAAIRSELNILASLTGRRVFAHYAQIWNAP